MRGEKYPVSDAQQDANQVKINGIRKVCWFYFAGFFFPLGKDLYGLQAA